MRTPDAVAGVSVAEDHIAKQEREIEAKETIISLQADEIATLKARVAELEAAPGESLVERWPFTGRSFPGGTAPVIY